MRNPVLPSFLIAIAAATASAQRTPDTRLNTNPAGGAISNRPRVAVNGDRICVVWQDTRSGSTDIRCNRSLDRGATWLSADALLDVGMPVGNSIAPELAVVGATVHVVWEDHRHSANNGDVYYNRSLDGGATWLPVDVRLDTGTNPGASDSRYPQVYAAGGTVCVVWADARNGSFDILANRSLDAGATWLPAAVRVDTGTPPGSSHSFVPRIAGSANTVHVVWDDERNGNRDVYYNRSLDGGATWPLADHRLDHAPATAFATDPRLAVAGANVCVVWEDDRNGLKDIYASRSLDAGATWLPADARLDTDAPGGGDSFDPLVASSGNAVYVVWQDGRTFVQPQVFFRRSLDGGTTWLGSDVLLNTTTSACFSFDAALAAEGNTVFVAWDSQACGGNGYADLYGNRSVDGGASWLPLDVRLDTDALGNRGSFAPSVGIDGDRCYVAWADARTGLPGRFDVYGNVPFGLLPYGAGTPGSGAFVPRLVGNGRGTLGSSVAFDVTAGLGGAVGAMLIGGPGSKVAIPVLGGIVLVNPLVSPSLVLAGPLAVPGAGATSLPLALPPTTTFVGFNLNLQAVMLDPGAPGGLSMTNGVELWIG